MPSTADVSATQRQELLRGALTVACLRALNQPAYGYGLVQALRQAGIATEGNTVYPLLRRLESQGLLASSWDTTSSRPRKFYSATRAGRVAAEALWIEFTSIYQAVDSLNQKVGP